MTVNLDRQRLLDRILKILALAEGTSFEGEAANARRMAEELIARFNIDLKAEGKPARDDIVVQDYVPWAKKWHWELLIARAVADLCGCKLYSYGNPEKETGST